MSMTASTRAARDAKRFRDYAYALTQRFATLNVTALMMMETTQAADMPGEVAPMVDNILLLEMMLEETTQRTIRIVKTRGSGYDARRYPLRITSDGIVVDRKRARNAAAR